MNIKKERKLESTHWFFFFAICFVLNRMHQKVRVRFLKDTILSESTDFIEKDYFF